MAASSLSAMHATGSFERLESSSVAEFRRSRPSTTETPAYNLFRYEPGPDLLCAVPEERPVPPFLDGQVWTYAGALRAGDVPPAGFFHAEADSGAQLNGFYLFHTAGRSAGEGPVPERKPRVRSGLRAAGSDRFHPPQPRTFQELLALAAVIGARQKKRGLP